MYFSSFLTKISSQFRIRFTIDLRALALFRVALAIGVISISLSRILGGAELFFESGPLPSVSRLGELSDSTAEGVVRPWSVLFLFSSETWVYVCAISSIIFGFFLLAGIHTRLATIACWILMASFRARNPYAGDGGDLIITILLFWGIFLPLSTYLSISPRKGSVGPRSYLHFSPGTVAILLQIALIYWIAAVAKFDASWRLDGSALAHALSLKSITRWPADLVVGWDSILRYSTSLVILIEEVGPFLSLLFPVTSRLRLLGPFAMIALHLGIALFFTLGIFPWICAAAWILFLPKVFWDFIFHISYFGAHEADASEDYEPHQSLPQSLFFRLVRYGGNGLVIVLIFVCFWSALTRLGVNRDLFSAPPWLQSMINITYLHQSWGYFAPAVNTSEGWFVVQIETQGGRAQLFDWAGVPKDEDYETEPPDLRKLFWNKRWRGQIYRVYHSRNEDQVLDYVNWVWSRIRDSNTLPLKRESLEVHFLLLDRAKVGDKPIKVQIFPFSDFDKNGKIVFKNFKE